MGPKFNDLKLLSNGKLEVSGPFDTHGAVLDEVVVRFLIIPADHDEESRTNADEESRTNANEESKIIYGTAVINELDPCECPNCESPSRKDAQLTSGTFREIVDNHPGLEVGDRARAIGLSVAVKKADGHDPPAFETFTWCVTVKVV